MAQPLLSVRDLKVGFRMNGSWVNAVEDVAFDLMPGETLGIVGESGSGKSVTALALMRLVERAGGQVTGKILLNGTDLTQLNASEVRNFRGKKMGMIFQEPMTSLNPVFSIGDQIAEVLQIHQGLSRAEAWKHAIDALDMVRISNPRQRVKQFPHELSGGMRQRVMIAMALVCKPEVLIADEPTTALDVTIQAQIMRLILELQRELNMGILLITHDLGVVAETCDRVLVMYGGRVAETAAIEHLFNTPQHPYTKGLINSIPRLGQQTIRLNSIAGQVPALGQFPSGCRFRNRCDFAFEQCRNMPELMPSKDVRDEHSVACWLNKAGS